MNLDVIRSFFAVVEHGSLSQAAVRLRVAQSTLTRQMHALEHEVGGRLLERTATGVSLTAAGRVFLDGMRAPLERIAAVTDETRRLVRGQKTTLRIGYIASAAREYLNPALAALRREHPEIKVRLIDASPGEQITGLRQGELDLALFGNSASMIRHEFFIRRLATLPMVVALPEGHTLAAQATVGLADLRRELFVGTPDADLPGDEQRLVKLCRRAGFRPRFLQTANSLAHALSTIVAEGAVAVWPNYVAQATAPGIVFRPIRDRAAKAELYIVWQRGNLADPVRAFLRTLPPPRG